MASPPKATIAHCSTNRRRWRRKLAVPTRSLPRSGKTVWPKIHPLHRYRSRRHCHSRPYGLTAMGSMRWPCNLASIGLRDFARPGRRAKSPRRPNSSDLLQPSYTRMPKLGTTSGAMGFRAYRPIYILAKLVRGKYGRSLQKHIAGKDIKQPKKIHSCANSAGASSHSIYSSTFPILHTNPCAPLLPLLPGKVTPKP